MVSYVTCNGLFSDCDMFWESTCGPRPEDACKICQTNVQNTLNDFWVQSIPLGSYRTNDAASTARAFVTNLDDEHLLDAVFEGFPISKYVISSVYSHLRINLFDLRNPKHVESLRSYLFSGIVAFILIRRMLEVEKPAIVLLFNGRLAVPKIALELCKRSGIRVVCHERGLVSESVVFFENESCLSLRPYQLLSQRWRDVPLSLSEFFKATRWLEDRRKGRNLSWNAFSVDGDLGSVEGFIQRYSGKSILGLFTSSTDEFAAEEEFKSCFGSQQEWIRHTVDLARNNSQIALIIRGHPNSGSKVSTGTNHSEIKFLHELAVDLPNNVYFISPDDPVSSYSLLKHLTVGLVYCSTIALEMACLGIPVACAATSPWIFCDSIELIKNPSDYPNLLKNLISLHGSSDTRLARIRSTMRFVYAYINRWNISFPLVRMPDIHNGILDCKSSDDLKPGKHYCLDYCADIILGIRDSIPSPLVSVKQYAELEETNALRMYVENIESSEGGFQLPLVSIIITCYNYGSYLRECVLSVVNQTFSDFEIIIVNDGSTDNSHDVIEACVNDFSKTTIRVIHQENSGHPAISRNNGIKISRGQLILPLDADDVLGAKMLSECVDVFKRNSELSVVYTDFISEYTDNSQQRHVAGVFHSAFLKTENQLAYCSMFRRDVWETVGGYRTNIGYEDWDFWLAASLAGFIGKRIPEAHFIYRAKDSGVFSDAIKKDNLHRAQLRLNNPQAFSSRELSESIQALQFGEIQPAGNRSVQTLFPVPVSLESGLIPPQSGKDPLAQAQLMAKEALVMNPQSPDALALLIRVLFKQQRWLDCAKKCQELLKIQPDSVNALTFLGDCLLMRNELLRAAAIYENILNLDPSNLSVKAKIDALNYNFNGGV